MSDEEEAALIASERDIEVGDFLPDDQIDDAQPTADVASGDEDTGLGVRHVQRFRDLVGFWVLGLTNNFAYVQMLSAAEDILEGTPGFGTGIILLADILPTLLVKATAPFFVHRIPYNVRVWMVTLLAVASFVTVAEAKVLWLSIVGVMCASFSSGLGEITFLSLSSHYHRNSVSAWSSGTGAAGAIGSLTYAGLTELVSPRIELLIMLIVPVLLALAYFVVLGSPLSPIALHSHSDVSPLLNSQSNTTDAGSSSNSIKVTATSPDESISVASLPIVEATALPFAQKLTLIKPLLKYMIPLFVVYYAEYCINQGLTQHIFWGSISLSKSAQYRWMSFTYQLGVFVSRSSVNFVQFRRLWILALLQVVNFVFLLIDARFEFITASIWIMFGIIFYEGLLGGATYVNAFANITKEVESSRREWSLGVASVADTCGIALAGATAVGLNAWLQDIVHPR